MLLRSSISSSWENYASAITGLHEHVKKGINDEYSGENSGEDSDEDSGEDSTPVEVSFTLIMDGSANDLSEFLSMLARSQSGM